MSNEMTNEVASLLPQDGFLIVPESSVPLVARMMETTAGIKSSEYLLIRVDGKIAILPETDESFALAKSRPADQLAVWRSGGGNFALAELPSVSSRLSSP